MPNLLQGVDYERDSLLAVSGIDWQGCRLSILACRYIFSCTAETGSSWSGHLARLGAGPAEEGCLQGESHCCLCHKALYMVLCHTAQPTLPSCMELCHTERHCTAHLAGVAAVDMPLLVSLPNGKIKLYVSRLVSASNM